MTDNKHIQHKEDLNLLDYIDILWVKRKNIFINVVTVTFVSVVISSIMPKTYTSSTVIMPPKSQSDFGILGAFSDFPMSDLLLKTDNETMNFIAILKSRTVMESVIDKFNLLDYYNADNTEDVIKILEKDIHFAIDPEGTIRISSYISTGWFHAEDDENYVKILSANISNYFAEKLDEVNKNLQSQEASFQRIFIEKRYRENIEELKNVENKLKIFQEENKMVSLSDQAAASIEIAATMKAQLLANEIELGVAKALLHPTHPDIFRIKEETEQLIIKLNQMSFGSTLDTINDTDMFPVFSAVPDLGLKLGRLTRDVEIQNTLFSFLTQQYEEAKIKEAKDSPTIQILDIAIPPKNWYKPKRLLIIISTAFSSLLIIVFYTFILDKIDINRRLTHN